MTKIRVVRPGTPPRLTAREVRSLAGKVSRQDSATLRRGMLIGELLVAVKRYEGTLDKELIDLLRRAAAALQVRS